MYRNVKRGLFLSLLPAAALCLTACGVTITGISLPADCALTKGDSAALEVTYTPEQETTDEALAEAAAKLALTWTSADETVATVDETGTVTAVGAGTTEITAAAADAGLQSACTVTVAVPLEGLKAPDALALVVNGENSADLDVALVPADATDVKLTYASSDPAVATVDANGTVTAVANGACTITASADSGSKAETSVTVTTLAEEIQLKTTEGILTVGDDFTITAALLPETVSQPGLVWKSSDEAIATVDQNGKTVAKAKGSATITVTSADGAASAEYALTVNAVKCSYCGKEGHTAANCPQKAADQQAAQQAAQQQAAAQAAQPAVEQAAQQAAQQATEQAAQQQAAAPAPEPNWSDNPYVRGPDDPNIIPGTAIGLVDENECPAL